MQDHRQLGTTLLGLAMAGVLLHWIADAYRSLRRRR
jgi:hypothetical protein